MKQKYEGEDLQSLVELGREQGCLTFDQVNDFLPQEVSSPTDLRSALESFQDMDIKVLADAPADATEGELEAEVKEGPDETAEAAPAADSIGESSDPVRLYLREMGNFQLLSREQEVEIAKRIEAGESEVEEEVLRSPVMLDLVIERARPTCATSSRRTKSLPTPTRSVGARPAKSNSNSSPPRPPSSSRCAAGSKSSRRNSRGGPSRS